MSRPELHLIYGSLDYRTIENREFVSAYVTDTRLMGVVAMHMQFRHISDSSIPDFHQFFYFDAEEFGFDNYEGYVGSDQEKVRAIESSFIGGLGGRKISISFREAKHLLAHYAAFNREHAIKMPAGYREYSYLLETPSDLSEEEITCLYEKQCVEMLNDYHVVNYFLMRCCGRDFSAVMGISDISVEKDLFPEFTMSTFLSNSIEQDKSEQGVYICRSLVENDDRYFIAMTSVKVENRIVTGYERINIFQISEEETSMQLAREEYITVYNFSGDAEDFGLDSTELIHDAMLTRHETGNLYMIFNKNNDHVAKSEYRLHEDVMGIYYMTNQGQLLSAAYSGETIAMLEQDIEKCEDHDKLRLTNRYVFNDTILLEFIQSGFEDFNIFAAINNLRM